MIAQCGIKKINRNNQRKVIVATIRQTSKIGNTLTMVNALLLLLQ